jgi:hypothetical protein
MDGEREKKKKTKKGEKGEREGTCVAYMRRRRALKQSQ